jgi:hypothetical protein
MISIEELHKQIAHIKLGQKIKITDELLQLALGDTAKVVRVSVVLQSEKGQIDIAFNTDDYKDYNDNECDDA